MADEGQDFLSLGLDISGFDAQKMSVLREYISLFDQLTKYDGKVINPILGPGLTELNSSISQTSKLLDGINSKLSEFASNSTVAAGATKAAASSSKLLTDEQAKQKVQIQELNRLKIEQAKSENLLSQSRINAKNAIREQFESESQLANEQKKNSALIQAMIKKQADDEERLAKQQQRDLELIAKLRKKDADEQAALIRKQAKIEEEEAAQMERDHKKILKLQAEQATASNRAVVQSQKEQAANKSLRDDYYQLTLALKDQATAYSNLFINKGKNDPATKAALAQYGETAGVIGQIDKKLQSAQPAAFGLGKGLSTMYNHLRMIAYILPGIGVAGIFNLAIQAVQGLIELMDGYNDDLNKILTKEDEHNKYLKDQLEIIRDLRTAEKEYLNSIDNSRGVKPGESGAYGQKQLNPENQLKQDEAKGLDALTLSTDKLRVANDKLATSKFSLDQLREQAKRFNISGQFENDEELTTRLEKKKNEIFADVAGKSMELDELKKKADDLNTKVAEAKNFSMHDDYPGQSAFKKHDLEIRLEYLNNAIKEKQSDLDVSNSDYKGLESTLTDFYNSKKEASDADLEHQKFISDQERRLFVETNQSRVSVQQNTSSIILSDIRSTHEEKIRELKAEREEQARLNELERINVTGTKDNPNVSASPYDIRIARQKEYDDNLKANAKYKEAVLKENIEFYQKELKARIDIQKDIVNTESINNEKIQSNEKSSLKERLDAYANYITEKTKLEELDFEFASSAGKSFEGDKGSLTPNQIKALQSARDNAVLQSKADAESKIYEIVHSSGQKQLNDIKEEYESEQVYSKENLINDLVANNEKYDRREESLRKWQKRKKEIEDKDKKEEFQIELDRDTKNFKRLLDLRTQQEKDLADSTEALNKAKALPVNTPDKDFIVNQAKGRNEANIDLLKGTGKAVKTAGDQVQQDRFNMANVGKDAPEKLQEWAKMVKEIENELYKDVKSFTDAGYEYRLAMLEKQKALIDEQYGYEIQAIEKSSLSQKDKAALDIQLQEQKIEFDKKAQQDEKQIKVQQAEFDKKLAIAHIIIGTAAAVVEALPNIPKSVAAGVVGALELATVIATPIPSFAEGVKGFKGGIARYGEAGMEVVKEPGKQARLVVTETVSYLPKGTDIIPVKDSPVFEERLAESGWDQTLYLAKEIKKLKQEPKKITNIIKIDLGFENYKKKVLGNG